MARPYEIDAALTGLVQEYGNCAGDFISDCVFPAVKTCGMNFKFTKFDEGEAFNMYNDLVGPVSQVNEISMQNSGFVLGETECYALESVIPMTDYQQQNCSPCSTAGYDLEAAAVKNLVRSLMLNRDYRNAQFLFDTANYTNQTSLAGQELNSGAATAADPLDFISEVIACAKYGLNYAVMNKKVFHWIRKHPSVLGSSFARGLTSEDQVAAALGLEGICIANSCYNSAGLGLPPVINQTFGNSILLFQRGEMTLNTACPSPSFGFNAVSCDAEVYKYFDESIGLKGGYRIKYGVCHKDTLVDETMGHLITDVLV